MINIHAMLGQNFTIANAISIIPAKYQRMISPLKADYGKDPYAVFLAKIFLFKLTIFRYLEQCFKYHTDALLKQESY